MKYLLLLTTIIFFYSCKNSSSNKKNDTDGIDDIVNYRPSYHFTPDSNWINDANGLVYYDGEYHLFYQYNPFGNVWGHMSWAHSVSTDLMHWKTLPIALMEDKNKKDNDTSMIFSGSAVVDATNSSGLGTTGNTPLVAVYTAFVHGGQNEKGDYIPKAQNQAIAYSNDKGRSWIKYDGNPVLDIKSLEFRDPKVFWYEPQKKWVMVVSKPDEHETWFYKSKNLKDWSFMSKWGKAGDTTHFWECPDLIELKVNNSSEKKWVMLSSSGNPQEGFYGGMQYFVGDFDGNKFTPVQNYAKPVYLDFGKDYYAAVTYNNVPNERKISVGWMNNWEYAREIPTGDKWRGAFAVPRELSLIKSGNEYKLIQQPIKEYSALKKEALSVNEQSVDAAFNLNFKGNVYELELEIEPGTAKAAGIKLLKSKEEETVLKYDAESKQFLFDRTKSGNVSFNKKFPSVEKAPVSLTDGKLKLKILVDKCIVEVFINDGETTLTELVFPNTKEGEIQLFSEGGKSIFKSIKIWDIKPVK
jgi:fructan beta-fructosidase